MEIELLSRPLSFSPVPDWDGELSNWSQRITSSPRAIQRIQSSIFKEGAQNSPSFLKRAKRRRYRSCLREIL